MPQDTFLSCDWGTSHFRLRLVELITLNVLDEIKTDEGVGSIVRSAALELRRERFAEIFTERVQELSNRTGTDPKTCIISGMASSNIGWQQLPYVKAPVRLDPTALRTYPFTVQLTEDRDIQVILISGACTEDDIMRGEETELLGLLEAIPDLRTTNAIVVLPGTHSKHARLEYGVLTSFTTYMTGELYAHLQDMPTLKGSLAGSETFNEDEFLAGVDCASKIGLTGALFKIRSKSVLDPEAKPSSPSFLSGLLISAELADIHSKTGWAIYICSSSALMRQYSLAAEKLGLSLRFIPSDIVSKALVQAHNLILKQSRKA